MSNRLLALLVLVLFFGGLYWVYYYFFVANVGALTVITTGAEDVSVTIDSEFQKSYSAVCKKTCQFPDIPPVGYTLTAKKDGFIPVEKTFDIERGKTTRLLVRMDPEVKLKELGDTPDDDTNATALDEVTDNIDLDGSVWSIKDTSNPTIKLVTSERWVFTYSTDTKALTENPLYDDILPLPSWDLVTLVKKTSKTKLSLLNLEATGNDYILLVNIEKKTRKVLLQTKTNGRNLEYRDRKVLLVNSEGKWFEIENVE